VAGLRVGYVDLMHRVLTVAETVTRDAKGRPVHSKTTKSQASKRALSIPKALADLLSEHMARVELSAASQDSFLFEAPNGGPLRYSNWRARTWLPAIASTGHAGAGFHDLRRTNATVLVMEKVDMKTAQVRLGHSDARLTLALYAQAVEAADRQAAETLGRQFFGLTKTNARDGRAIADSRVRRKATNKPA
jgi:integrase